MPRLMSVALSTPAVRDRSKTVTRRAGWTMLAPGGCITLCPKVQGHTAGDPLERIVTVQVISVRRERLDTVTADDVRAEGFPAMKPPEFVEFFNATHRGIRPTDDVTRVEWAYPTDGLGAKHHDDKQAAITAEQVK